MARSLAVIAEDIRTDWTRPYFGALPYIEAMRCLNEITDSYFCDRGEDVVRYFLANAKTWRGEKAREVKAELKSLLNT